MQEKRKPRFTGEQLYHIFIYVVLAVLAICILVPVAWVFMASIKQNAEFYGSPWALPLGVYWQNFVDAWTTARMGEFMLNSVLTTAIALALLLVVALPPPMCSAVSAFGASSCSTPCSWADCSSTSTTSSCPSF